MSTNEIATRDTQTLVRQRDELDVADVTAQVRKIQEVMRSVMKNGEHYGTIPGTDKPTLLQPGADKLILTFRFDPEFAIEKTWDGEHLTIDSTCTLYHIPTGLRLGSGGGSCSTKESKYRWREAKATCPTCRQPAIIKGKAEYGGGWLCFKKRGGCGAKFRGDDARITGQKLGRVPNEDLADAYNTVKKIANKRAKVAAVLNVTAASDIFTQDLEEDTKPPADDDPPGSFTVSPPSAPSAAPTDPNDPDVVAQSEANFPAPDDDVQREQLLNDWGYIATQAKWKGGIRAELWNEHVGKAVVPSKATIAQLTALVAAAKERAIAPA
jgi:hypothetical protein